MTIKASEMEEIAVLISQANNNQLKDILKLVEDELRLSETAIKEGFEKRW